MRLHFTALQLGLLASFCSTTALADSWVQIQALPTLTSATEAARSYAARIPSIAGFKQSGRWHSIAIGPFETEDQASAVRRTLLAEGLIPSDSYLTDGENYRQAFWPIGGALLQAPILEADPFSDPLGTAPVGSQTAEAITPNPAEQIVSAPEDTPVPAETRSQARQSEAALNRADREALQIALKFAGFYTSGIDGSFGPGTRRAMAAWQTANGFEDTGIMTTAQRAQATATYTSFIASLGFETVTDTKAGLTIELPLGLVAFDSYDPPFVKYKSINDSGVEILLISQSGDSATLAGLYDVMQTLEIVPIDGERRLQKNEFTLSGTDARSSSHTEASLRDGHVKGFTVIWPSNDLKRRDLALDAMRGWTRTAAVLPDVYGEVQSIDLLAGMTIRRADRIGSGMYVDSSGHVLTSASLVENCTSITLEDAFPATLTHSENGLALLTPSETIIPVSQAQFDTQLPPLRAEVSVSGYAYEGRLGAPSLNYGHMAEHAGLNGEPELLRLDLTSLAGEVGGPVLSKSGTVIGMLHDMPQSTRALPATVSLAYNAQKLTGFLSQAGIAPSTIASSSHEEMEGPVLTRQAQNMTALVSCWQ
jgi:hypothetical protein